MRKPILASIAVLGLLAAPAMAATHKAKADAHKTVKVAKTKTTVEKKAK